MPFDLTVTSSIGTCTGALSSEADWKALYRNADRALFEAKTAGRDRSRHGAAAADRRLIRERPRVGIVRRMKKRRLEIVALAALIAVRRGRAPVDHRVASTCARRCIRSPISRRSGSRRCVDLGVDRGQAADHAGLIERRGVTYTPVNERSRSRLAHRLSPPRRVGSRFRPAIDGRSVRGDAPRAQPDAPLLDFLGRNYSYGEIADGANRVACGLAALGYGPGDRIGLFLPNVPHYVAAYYGILKLGATVVNFSPLYTVDELAHQVADSGTRLLFTLSATALLPTALKVLERQRARAAGRRIGRGRAAAGQIAALPPVQARRGDGRGPTIRASPPSPR